MEYPSAVIKETIDRILANSHDQGKQGQYIYEGSDERFIRASMTKREAYLVELELYGKEVANNNYFHSRPT